MPCSYVLYIQWMGRCCKSEYLDSTIVAVRNKKRAVFINGYSTRVV